MNLNHIHLHVASVEDAAAFYEWCFGMRQHVWHGDMVFMRDDAGMDLALAPGGAEPMPDWFHIGFRLESAEAVVALHDRAVAGGATIKQPVELLDDFAVFRLSDPDGYLLEVYWEP